MKNVQLQEKALRASFQLHGELLSDCAYEGYDGDKGAFDKLYAEVLVICSDELPDDADVQQICETFHEYMLEQMNGVREIEWYL